jgi:glycoside/pentoside/hexuronide:cation symporter, GPH family
MTMDVERPALANRIGYASGNFGKNLLWSAADLTLLFLLTDVFRIDAATAGFIILLSLGVNAVLDPVVGAFADRMRSPWGRNGPLIIIGAPICGAAFALLYALPSMGGSGVFAAATALVLFRAAFSMIDAPHNALLASMAQTTSERSALSAIRLLFSSLATLTVIGLLPPLMAAREAAQSTDLALVALAAALVSTSAMVVAARATRGVDQSAPDSAIQSAVLAKQGTSVFSRPILLLLTITMVVNAGVPLFAKMILYHATYVVADPDRATHMLIALVLGQIVSLPLWTTLVRRIDTVAAMMCACALVAACAVAFSLFGGTSQLADIQFALAFGMTTCGLYTLIWVLVADASDRFSATSGARATVLIFALVIVAIKAGQGIGAGLTGLLLASVDYRAVMPASESVIGMIGTIQAVGPMLASLAALGLLAALRRGENRSDPK